MAGDPNAGARSSAVQSALSVVDLGRQAATAYARADLTARLVTTRKRLSDPAFHVFVIGEFKQGKSSLVNRLLHEERMIVSEVPGTTRDSVDSVLTLLPPLTPIVMAAVPIQRNLLPIHTPTPAVSPVSSPAVASTPAVLRKVLPSTM